LIYRGREDDWKKVADAPEEPFSFLADMLCEYMGELEAIGH